MIDLKELEFIEDIGQHEYNGRYYDLHNEYECIKIRLEDGVLRLNFRHVLHHNIVGMEFMNVVMTVFNIQDLVAESLTIDNIYRGRFLEDEILKDLSADGKSYMYIDFVEEISFEFFSDGLVVNDFGVL